MRVIRVAAGYLLVSLFLAACSPSSAEQPGPPPATVVETSPVASAGETLETPAATAGPELLASDIQIRRVAVTRGGMIRLARDPESGDLFYLDGSANLYRLTLQPEGQASGELAHDHSDIGGAENTTGMAFGPNGALYISGNINEGDTTRATIRKGAPDGSGTYSWSAFATTESYPLAKNNFDHLVNGLAVSPDGEYVFVNSGSRTDHGEVETGEGAFPDVREVPLTSAVFRIPTDGSDVVIPGDEAELNESGYLFADGLRNSYDLEFSPEGELFAGDNGPDADFPDELNWIREDHHYGFPWRFGVEANPQASPDYDPSQDKRLPEDFVAVQRGTYENDPEFPPPPDVTFTEPVTNLGPGGDQYRAEDGSQQDASEQGEPLHTFTPHRSPLGLSFDKDGALSGDWEGSAFILSWGSAGGTLTDKGQDLLALKLAKDGDNYTAEVRQIARGFDHPIDSVLIGKKLYVLDYGGDGVIWELSFP